MAKHSIEVVGKPKAVLARVAAEADQWGGAWDGLGESSGKLGLPVSAGLQRGWVEGNVQVESKGEKSLLTFEEDHSAYQIDRGSVMILVAAAVGCLVVLLSMFVSVLLPLLPIGSLLAIGAYLVVIARLRNSGPEEFFEAVSEEAE